MFLNEPREYKGICLRSFCNNYPAQIDEFSVDALSFSSLEPDAVDFVYEKFTAIEEESRNLPASRDIRVSGKKLYSIVGVQPFKDDFREALFDISLAKKQVEKSAHTFIDSHYSQVREQCKPIPKIKSNKVLLAPCCGEQFHEPCLVSCRDYGVSSCPGRFCQRAENGKYYGKTWDAAFYQQMMQAPALDRNEIKNDTCSLCEDFLKASLPNIPLRSGRSLNHTDKKQKK